MQTAINEYWVATETEASKWCHEIHAYTHQLCMQYKITRQDRFHTGVKNLRFDAKAQTQKAKIFRVEILFPSIMLFKYDAMIQWRWC